MTVDSISRSLINEVGINNKVHNNNNVNNVKVDSNLNQTILHKVHTINKVQNNNKVNMEVNSNCSQSLINTVLNNSKVRNNNKVHDIKVDS